MLLGFLAPTRGRVSIEGADCIGIDLAALDCEEWHERLGWLPQRPTLFSGTLRSNVCLGQAGVDDATVVRALQSAGAGALLAKLPHGLDTPVGENGQGLSSICSFNLIARGRLKLQPDFVCSALFDHSEAIEGSNESEQYGATAVGRRTMHPPVGASVR